MCCSLMKRSPEDDLAMLSVSGSPEDDPATLSVSVTEMNPELE